MIVKMSVPGIFIQAKVGKKKWKLDDAMLFIIAIPTSVSPLWG